MGSRSPQGNGQFWKLSEPLEITASQCCGGLCSKKSITATAGLRQPAAILRTLHCPPVKNLRLRCGLLSEFFDHLFNCSLSLGETYMQVCSAWMKVSYRATIVSVDRWCLRNWRSCASALSILPAITWLRSASFRWEVYDQVIIFPLSPCWFPADVGVFRLLGRSRPHKFTGLTFSKAFLGVFWTFFLHDCTSLQP